MRIGIAADHGGFELKVYLTTALKAGGYEVVDFGAHELVTGDDYFHHTWDDCRCGSRCRRKKLL